MREVSGVSDGAVERRVGPRSRNARLPRRPRAARVLPEYGASAVRVPCQCGASPQPQTV